MKSIKPIKPALLAVALSLCVGAATAQSEVATPDNSLRIATGKKGKGYSKLFADLQAVCGSKVALSEVETEGGLQNLTTLASNQADLGFTQIDTLVDMKDTDETIGSFLAVLPLNSNLLHVVARVGDYPPAPTGGVLPDWMKVTAENRPLNTLSDLKGRTVALVGSAQKVVRVLDRRNNLGLTFIDMDTDEQALARLKSGKIAAVFTSSGWPHGHLFKLSRDSGFKLLDFDLPSQAPYLVMKKNYQNMGSYNVSFLASPNVLVTRPFKAGGNNYKAVLNLQACIAKNLGNLQEGRFEPAWAEVKGLNDTFGWARFADSSKR